MAASIEVSHIDLECGGGHRHSSAEVSVCFSDADDEGSCYSQFYSTHDGSYDDEDDYSFACGSESDHEIAGGVSDSRRISSASESDCSIDIENGVDGEIKVRLEKVEIRDCRICHLTLESSNSEFGIGIELGCCCKDDLAAAHKHCAEAWFKIKGNKTCEICNSVARNVFTATEIESTQLPNETNATTTTATNAVPPSTAENRGCLNGHRFLNFLLACMVFAFVISWLFHFNIPS